MNTAEYNKGVDEYADGLYRFMLKLCNDANQAQDLVQEAFEKLWLKKSEIEFEKFKPYVFKIGYNLFVNQHKRASKFEAYDSKTFYYEDNNQVQSVDLKEQIDKALSRLPEIQKTVVMLRDCEGYSYEEIAELTEISLSQVKVYIFRARQTLKNYLVTLENFI